MSDDRKETFSLDGGKYEIDRNQAGLMIGARRHGEPWPAGFEQLRNMGVVHAMLDRIEADREAMQQALEAQPEPIDMVLHCPACGMQHIDAPSDDAYDGNPPTWNNPPHRSHLCHGCGHVWRPADVPTNGVAAVKTKGKNDTAIATLRTAIAEAKKVADAPVLSRYVMHDNHTFTKLPADNDVAYALAMKCFDDDGGWVDLCGAWSDERTSPRRRRPVSLQAHGPETRAEFAAATLKWLQENPGGQDE